MSVSYKGTTFAGVILDPTGGIGRNTSPPSRTACSFMCHFYMLGTGFEGFGGHQTFLDIRSTASGATARLALDPSTHNLEMNISGTITGSSTNVATGAYHHGAITLGTSNITMYWDGSQIFQTTNPFSGALDGLIIGTDNNDGGVYTDAFDGEMSHAKAFNAEQNSTAITSEKNSATIVDTTNGYGLWVMSAASSVNTDTFGSNTLTSTGAIIDGSHTPTFGGGAVFRSIFFGGGF